MYIEDLRTGSKGTLILESNKKNGFLGFIMCMPSLTSIYKELINCSNPPMSFLMTYKFSQDHQEMFFSAIRSKGGFNNNPTAKLFKAAYKQLLTHHQITTTDTCNCFVLEEINILNVSSSIKLFTGQ